MPRVKAGGGGVTVWGAFHADAKCDLEVLDGNLDQHKYITILEDKLLHSLEGLLGITLSTKMTMPHPTGLDE